MQLEKINFEKEGINAIVGKNESMILDSLLKKKKATCKEIYYSVKGKAGIAQTSVTVYLDRMHKKGLVEREVTKGKGGLIYIYSPAQSKQKLMEDLSEKYIHFMKRTFGEASIAYLKKKLE